MRGIAIQYGTANPLGRDVLLARGLINEIQWLSRGLGIAELRSLAAAGSAGLCYRRSPANSLSARLENFALAHFKMCDNSLE